MRGKYSNGYWIGVYAVFGVIQIAVTIYAWVSVVSGVLLASKTLHEKLLVRIMHSPMEFFDTTPMGRVMNRFSKDIDILDAIMQRTIRFGFIL